jgi:hypothetical protein
MDPMPPEALIEDSPLPLRGIAHELRAVVTDAFPDAIERVRPGWRLIGYDLPVDRPGRSGRTGASRRTVYFAWIWPEVEHVHLGFEHGWAMHDPRRVLKGAGITKRVRWLTFRPGDTIDRVLCAELLREAAAVARLPRGERTLRAIDAATG